MYVARAGVDELGQGIDVGTEQFFKPLCSNMSATISCLPRSVCSTSSLVTYWPVLVFLGLSVIFISSKSTSPTCFGDDTLNSRPARLCMRSSRSFIRLVRMFDVSASDSVSILTPPSSIEASTGISGISMSAKSDAAPMRPSSGSSLFSASGSRRRLRRHTHTPAPGRGRASTVASFPSGQSVRRCVWCGSAGRPRP